MKRLIVAFLVLNLLNVGCKNIDKDSNTLIIFHAGSLSMPLKAIADSFIVENPGVKILMEAAGSVECARKITEIKREADIMASADYKIIDNLLIPQYATKNYLFAGNEMVLVYTKKSKYSNEINANNWYEILLRSNVHYGRSDPNADPCGYRTLLTLQLAQRYYNIPYIAEQIEQKDNRFIRPKEVDLLALLETGAIDYIFLYRSVAVQHGLDFLILPTEINLGNADYSDYYAQASVKIRGSAPSDTLLITGEPMVYGITIPTNAPNKLLAEKYLSFFLHRDKGLKIIERMGMPLVDLKND
jgi:molybdate/tungstate transport system substrate-binding protein